MTRYALNTSALVLLSALVVVGLACSDDRGRSRPRVDSGVTPPVVPLTCDDGLRNGDETHLDCGGSCPPCADGLGCVVLTDCISMVCRSGFCLMPSCNDAMLNGAEIAVDCGAGGTCPGCPGGTACTTPDQCLSRLCDDGTCSDTSCSDGMMNADESDIDCGGSICTGCPGDRSCTMDSDCRSLICDAGTCTTAGCGDSVINQGETDIDCGGPNCVPCGPSAMCVAGTDCTSLICDSAGACTTSDCADGVMNQDETDIDCGGDTCGPCVPTEMCVDAGDCDSSVCDMGICQAPACDDGVSNGGETDVDCGGSTACSRCADFRRCTDPADCTAAACTMGFCGATGCMPFSAGPTDTFGYFGCSLPLTPATLPCPDISATGTGITLSDDSRTYVPIGFGFDFYGTSYTSAAIQTNGAISFADEYLTLSNACLPDATASRAPYIATYWDDLDPVVGGSIVYQTVGTAPNRQFVTRWDTEHYSSSPTNAVFTSVLNEGSGDVQ
ncbi:MAG: hypothetical protein JRH11_17980, partial [Deltaproteobacteria bacterium]|nr:hypothetical protein [Deltaproteobacteria bacterium]